MPFFRCSILILGCASFLSGSSAAPDAAANGVLDRLFYAIQKGVLPQNDIAILERAAEGRFAEADLAVVLSLGISRDQFSPLGFMSDGVRAHAYSRIGDMGNAEAIRYLSEVTEADAGKDYSKRVWPAARIALRVARLKQIPDPQAQIEFVRKCLTAEIDGHPDGQVRFWAEEELCNRGDRSSLVAIHERSPVVNPGPRGEQRWQSCKVRMEIVSSNPNRAEALGSVLRLDGGREDLLLISWALKELEELHSSAAHAVVARFRDQIRQLPKDSPAAQHVAGLTENIRETLAHLEDN